MTEDPNTLKAWNTPERVAEYLEVSVRLVRQWCGDGRLPGDGVIRTHAGKSGQWRISREAVLQRIEDMRCESRRAV